MTETPAALVSADDEDAGKEGRVAEAPNGTDAAANGPTVNGAANPDRDGQNGSAGTHNRPDVADATPNGTSQGDSLKKLRAEAAKKKRQQEKRARRREKKKTDKKGGKEPQSQHQQHEQEGSKLAKKDALESDSDDVEVVYVSEPAIDQEDPNFEQFTSIFERFSLPETEEEAAAAEITDDAHDERVDKPAEAEKEGESDSEDEEKKKIAMSKKKLKKLNRLSVAELKQLVPKPEVVEWVDVTAQDPKLLVYLKSYRNTVPVPQHWSQKRKYLQNKRGIEKPPFELPDFIKDTGIMEIRSAVKEKEEAQKLKAKMRERMAPKLGKIDIDYQKLHDAFFRYQTKPKLTVHGELYYEGKEFETKLKERKPGDLSEELIAALNIPPLAPPPWLINMQRYGPPPSYPSLKIPGLNAPIPEGAQWGYHPGGWGKPPVDEYNRPLYGDVFGIATHDQIAAPETMVPVERDLWGGLESESEEEEEEDEEMEEGHEEEEDGKAAVAEEDIREGLVTPSGISSVPSGLETPEFIELRKDVRRQETEGPKTLYQVLPERQTSISGFMGSQHGYDLSNVAAAAVHAAAAPSSAAPPKGTKRKLGAGVDVALEPSDLENLDEAALREKYDAAAAANAAVPGGVPADREDFSDMVAEHAGKQAKKRKRVEEAKSKEKKGKEFKF